MEIQNIFTKGLSLTSSTSNEKNKESKEKKIGRYLGKYNLFKANLENKIRSRLNFLKEKVIKNVDEIRRLAQILFTQKIAGLPASDSDKKKYFHILKTKKQREVNSKEDENYLGESKLSSNDRHSDDYEQFFDYKQCSSDSNESENSETLSENEELCDKFSQTTINPISFRKAFSTNFLSLNQFKDEDTESDLTSKEKQTSKMSFTENIESISKKSITKENISSEEINISMIQKDLLLFNNNEMNSFNCIFNELNELNLAVNDPNKLNSLLNSEAFQELRKKKKYNMISPETKRKYVEMAKETDAKEVSRNFGIPLKSLKRWLLLGHERKKGGGRKLKDPEMEMKLYDWYKEYHDRNQKIVTAKLIKTKALELTKCKDFIASKGWLEKFRKQHNLDIIRETTARKIFDFNNKAN